MSRPLQRSRIRRRTIVGALASTFASIGFVRAPARAARFTWKYSSANTADHPANVAIVPALAKIRAETNGDLDIKPFLNSALGGDSAVITQLRLGAVETMLVNGGTIDTVVPIASIEGIAFAFTDHKMPFVAMDGELGAYVRNELRASGFIAIEREFENGFRYFTSAGKPIRQAGDLEGVRFRVSPGKLFYDTFHSLGVSSTTLNLNELYVGLQTHLVDAQETPLQSIENFRLYEVQKYCSLSRHMWSGYWFLTNHEKWDALPRTYQEIMRKHIGDAAIAQRRASAASELALRDKLQRQGLAFNPIDVASFKAKLVSAGFYTRWRETYGATAWSLLEKTTGKLG